MIAIQLGRYLNTRPAIGNRLSNRIYASVVPHAEKDNYPRCIVGTIGGQPDYSLSGEIPDLAKTIQVDVDALTPNEAIEIADLIRQEITFFEGTWDDTIVKSCTDEGERDQSFSPLDKSDQWVFRRSIDYRVTYVR